MEILITNFWIIWSRIIKGEYNDKLSKGISDAHEAKKNEVIEIFGWIFDFFPFKKGEVLKPLNEKTFKKIKKITRNFLIN